MRDDLGRVRRNKTEKRAGNTNHLGVVDLKWFTLGLSPLVPRQTPNSAVFGSMFLEPFTILAVVAAQPK